MIHMALSQEELMKQGSMLAEQCAQARVLENQLATVLAHLKRHQDTGKTIELLKTLSNSPFARRTKSTGHQMQALERLVRPVLSRTRDWQEAATIIGWAKRLAAFYQPRRG
jgi:hypothetical protein